MADLKLAVERRRLQLKANILHRRAKIAAERDALVKDRQELKGMSGSRSSASSGSSSSTSLPGKIKFKRLA